LILATFPVENSVSAQIINQIRLTADQTRKSKSWRPRFFLARLRSGKPKSNSIVYRDEYFKKGSADYREFASRLKVSNSCNLVTTDWRRACRLKAQSAKIENYKPQMLASLKLKEIYPGLVSRTSILSSVEWMQAERRLKGLCSALRCTAKPTIFAFQARQLGKIQRSTKSERFHLSLAHSSLPAK